MTVESRTWWIRDSYQAELAPQTVPQHYQFRALGYSGSFNPVPVDGFMKVTILRDGEVVQEYDYTPGSAWPVGMQPSDIIGSVGPSSLGIP